MPLVAKVSVALSALLTKTADFASDQAAIDIPKTYTFADGVGADQATKIYSAELTILASANQDLDLSGGLNDPFGVAFAFTAVKALEVRADPGNTNNVVVGGAAATQWVGPFGAAAHTISVAPGGELTLVNRTAAGWPVVNAASDLLRVANSGAGTSVKFKIVIIGI